MHATVTLRVRAAGALGSRPCTLHVDWIIAMHAPLCMMWRHKRTWLRGDELVLVQATITAATTTRITNYLQHGRFLDAYTRQAYMSLVTFNSQLRIFGVWELHLERSQDGRFHATGHITEVFEQTYDWQSGGLWRLTVDASTALILLANIAVVLSAWNERFDKMWARKGAKVCLVLVRHCLCARLRPGFASGNRLHFELVGGARLPLHHFRCLTV